MEEKLDAYFYSFLNHVSYPDLLLGDSCMGGYSIENNMSSPLKHIVEYFTQSGNYYYIIIHLTFLL